MSRWLIGAGNFEGRIIDVALGAAAIQGGGIQRVQGRALLQSFDQIRVADEGAAKGKQIGLARVQVGVGQVEVITVVGQVGVLEAAA